MIVMKFGGSSVGSAAAVKRVASIVHSQVHLQPVVVVSAFGNTTDQFAAILKHAASGESYMVWKLIKELREYHFCIAEDLLGTRELDLIDRNLRQTFRDLHVHMSEACDGERTITAEEKASTLSLGEQISSLIVCAAFRQLGMASSHVDARNLILTDDQFLEATPRYWETYAKIRWTIPELARKSVVVLGGFIGATECGHTTTLGRGGSDLTATIVGAAINADEIQIWKDVDGILTADPRLKPDALLVKSLSYEEAGALAKAGAKVLHPETIAPAQRLRIPITLRNTFSPEAQGTSIQFRSAGAALKSIVCKSDITLLEISSCRSDMSIGDLSKAMSLLVANQKRSVELLGVTPSSLFLAFDSSVKDSNLPLDLNGCMETHVRSSHALITLIGDGIVAHEISSSCVKNLLHALGADVLPIEASSLALRIAVHQGALAECLNKLHQAFFASPDPNLFAKPSYVSTARRESRIPAKLKDRDSRIQQALTLSGTRLAVHH